MSFDGEESRWMCGRSGVANLHRFSSMVREIRDPCLHHSPSKGSKMLRPEKWQTNFDSDGKVIGFRKALKLIVLGGVDPSIRAEVWEFLLGCYALSSTVEYRKQLRMARRERYDDLIRQCQMMHSSVGTGSLAYVGSKVMDMRTLSRENDIREAVTENGQASCDATDKLETYSDLSNACTDTSYAHERKSSSKSAQLVSCGMSTDDSAYDSSYVLPSSEAYNCYPRNFDSDFHEPQYDTESFFDFPLPVINLFQEGDGNENETQKHEHTLRFGEEHMHSFQINNNVDLIMESNSHLNGPLCSSNNATDIFRSDALNHVEVSKEIDCSIEVINRSTMPDAPKEATVDRTTSSGLAANEDRVSEWLWTLHRIVIDVVRTDSHLEFYGDSKNMARMSDILAVYAWIDPATGYCQGMSDLLSPFVMLYEDNADAFWCFEMLLRRMRENFQIEGPTGVMKQLQSLWKILELTDIEISRHLLLIGAESLHFAFRMLLVLFRRELSFDEALRMWEMVWAADFDEALTRQLEENCLDPLVLNFRDNSQVAIKAEHMENGKRKFKSMQPQRRNGKAWAPYSIGVRSISGHPLCGLTKANFWSRHDQLQPHNTTASMRKGDDGLPVFCVAAILVINRQKIMRETHSFDDIIKMFNDNMLKINVKRCIHMAIKLRKKYSYKLMEQTSTAHMLSLEKA
ncbi:small G protein signaling modulator 1-like [Phoenix dactylifera]|uniref:Small G protein signaling modulator 1-like n=1 Tax=Phoenix dactylifera TaxID=42345 RepID=A0A8B9AVI8_PHODC|nr:small G protein signaling modulator 1-like [Phoenix dactylifera]